MRLDASDSHSVGIVHVRLRYVPWFRPRAVAVRQQALQSKTGVCVCDLWTCALGPHLWHKLRPLGLGRTSLLTGID